MNKGLVAIIAILVIVSCIQTYMIYQLDRRFGVRLSTGGQAPQAATPDFGQPPAVDAPNEDFFDGLPWNPYQEMQRMRNEMEHLFGDTLSRFHTHPPFGGLMKSPDADVQETADSYVVTLNTPGADESSVNIRLDGRS